MPSFMEITFGPTDFKIIDTALQAWRSHYALAKDDPDVSIAAEICINLYREGNRTVVDLQNAMARHKGLNEIAAHHIAIPAKVGTGFASVNCAEQISEAIPAKVETTFASANCVEQIGEAIPAKVGTGVASGIA